MKRICVYSGSNLGRNKNYKENAKKLGQEIAKSKIEMVYGGSKIGLMGEIANEVLKNSGYVIGVIPKELFAKERVHENLTLLIKTKDMQERKKAMYNLSDGFIAMPGGLGTYEELFEVLSWAQISIHKKPIGLLNTDNFFTSLIKILEKTCEAGFIKKSNMKLLIISDNPFDLLEKMKNYTPPIIENKLARCKTPTS